MIITLGKLKVDVCNHSIDNKMDTLNQRMITNPTHRPPSNWTNNAPFPDPEKVELRKNMWIPTLGSAQRPEEITVGLSKNTWIPTIIRVDDARLGANAYAEVSGNGAHMWGKPLKSHYMKPSTNAQIQSVMRGHGPDRYKLLNLLEKHGVHTNIKQGLNTADSTLYKFIKVRPEMTNPARDEGQAEHLHYHFRCGLGSTASFDNVIDIGGGNGGISAVFGKLVGAKNVTVVDPRCDKIQMTPGVKWQVSLDGIPNASQDLALCIFSMHHFTDLSGMLKEIKRVLKPGGLLFAKEHDCWNAVDAMMVDIEHGLFMVEHNETITDDHTLHFKNIEGWKSTLLTAGLCVTHTEYFSGPRLEVTPTRAFCMLARALG